ncbi:MAG: HAD-IB family hydrolase [Armatimonadetes bacterium]|nr:HAD-IB family hydrolase [Armatimonadota bacterium]MDW8122196.1 HAD family hydrolase [Armatimonadota bacterium]
MIAAFFDCDGTLTRTTVVDPLVWYQTSRLSSVQRLSWLARLLLRAPALYLAERKDREAFVHLFFESYRGLRWDEVSAWHEEHFEETLRRRVVVDGLKTLRWHQDQGHSIVLVTGGLDFVVRPLAQWLTADLIATRLEVKGGVLTGRVEGKPVVGEEKARRMQQLAAERGWVLRQCYAYGDSISDQQMLASTGHPCAVNPDKALLRLAREKGWPIRYWR